VMSSIDSYPANSIDSNYPAENILK
jgi:hypothetical protein